MNRGCQFLQIVALVAALSANCLEAGAQVTDRPVFRRYEDSLVHLGKMVVNGADETDRKAATYRYIPLLIRALKNSGSFDYPFDSVKSMRVVYSPDRTFRIFSWFVNINEIAYRFYGAIQMNTGPGGKLKLFPLVDASDTAAKAENRDFTASAWYGAEYYTILPRDAQGRYVLLGWKGLNEKVTSRLVDVLSFPAGKPVFGAPIFAVGKAVQHRLIFRYTHQASMMLRYLPQENAIVFDHLIPADKNQTGKYEFYGPDLTYDRLNQQDGQWKITQDVKLSNPGNERDRQFIQPEKKPVIQ